jgi:thiamine pyrophosphokinase
MPLFKEVTGVTTKGLRYELKDRTLVPGSSFSISNTVQKNASDIGVDFTGGTMLIMVTPAV